MALVIEKLSDTKIIIHDGGTNVMELDTTSGVRVIGSLKIDSLTGTNLVQGVTGVYKIARSATPVALDGSNPTSVAHGLTTCIAAFAQLSGSGAPGAGTSVLSCVINGANIDVYGWMPTGAALTGLIASTSTESFHWFAIGT